MNIKPVCLVVGPALRFMPGDPQPDLFAIGCNRDHWEAISTADSAQSLHLEIRSLVPDRVRQLLPKFRMDKDPIRLPGGLALKPPAADWKKFGGGAPLILSREHGCRRMQVNANDLGVIIMHHTMTAQK